MNPQINDAQALMILILERHFPFLKFHFAGDPSFAEDVRQSAELANYATSNFRDFYNYCQRELYALAKLKNYRRTRQNKWVRTVITQKGYTK